MQTVLGLSESLWDDEKVSVKIPSVWGIFHYFHHCSLTPKSVLGFAFTVQLSAKDTQPHFRNVNSPGPSKGTAGEELAS